MERIYGRERYIGKERKFEECRSSLERI